MRRTLESLPRAQILRRTSLLGTLLAVVVGCVPRPENSVVIYSAADREYAKPILGGFSRQHPGIDVAAQFDVESTKTVGLVSRIESEAQRPRCDVFWNNEVMHTLRLEQAGLLQPIAWNIPSDWPESMRSSDGNWVGIAARARILIINTEILPDRAEWPDSVVDLADAKWKDRCGLALPLFGTTATHFAILYQQLEEQAATELFEQIAGNATVLSGNKQVAQAVSSGALAFGLTDTDDALIEIDSGLPVAIVYPDQEPGQPGTLRIPNTVAVLANCPHPVAAAELANYLVSEDTEARLAMGPSGQFPVRPRHPEQSRAQTRDAIRWMDTDFPAAAASWTESVDHLRTIFHR